MILDDKLEIMDALECLTVATHAGTTLDFGSGYDAWGTAQIADYAASGDLWLNMVVNTAAASAGAPTLTASISSATTAAGSLIKHITTPAILKAALTAGAEIIRVPLPLNMNRYVNVQAVIAVSPYTAFKIDAYITRGVDSVS